MAARPIWRGQIRLAWSQFRSSSIRRPRAARPNRSSTRSMSRAASGSNMKRSCPVSARSTATRSSRATSCRRAIMSCSIRRRSRASSWRAARRSIWCISSRSSDIDPMYFDKPYYVVPADDLAEEAFVVLRDALRPRKGRHRPAGDARPGIYRRAQAVRQRHAAGNAALCRRGQQGAVLSSAKSAITSPMPTCSIWPRR